MLYMKKSKSIFLLISLMWLNTNLFAQDQWIYPFYASSTEEHSMTLLLEGPVALQARIDLIRSAQESIEFEYFVFDNDIVGGILLQELTKQAKKGVEVRILFDYFGTFTNISRYLVQELVDSGAKVRFYNHDLLNLYNAQFRNHRKNIIIDGQVVLSGGRNISTSYFGVDKDKNYADRDFILRGELVSAVRDGFFEYWNHDVTRARSAPRDRRVKGLIRRIRERAAQRVITRGTNDLDFIKVLESYTRDRMDSLPQFTCHDLTVATDVPGVGAYAKGENYRIASQVVFDRIYSTDRSVYIESPFVVFDVPKTNIINRLLDRGVEVSFKTNSLYNTVVMPVTTVFLDQVGDFLDRGATTYLFKGEAVIGESVFPGTEETKWSIHSKLMTFDDDGVMLGSFNFDPRSTVWNSEIAYLCNDLELRRHIDQNLNKRNLHSYFVDNSEDVEKYGLKNVRFFKRTLNRIIRTPSLVFSYLL